MLDVFLGRPLDEYDLPQKTVGQNLIMSRFDDTVDKVELALQILDKTGDLLAMQSLSVRTVSILVDAYGEEAESIISSLIERSSEIIAYLRLPRGATPGLAVGIALDRLAGRIASGSYRVLPMTFEEMEL